MAVRCTDWERTVPFLSQPVHGTATYRYDDTRDCIVQFWPPGDEHLCSKHVEAWNKLIIKLLCIKLVNIKINILRCTVSKISKFDKTSSPMVRHCQRAVIEICTHNLFFFCWSFPSRNIITYKYNMSVSNTTFLFYIPQNSILVRATCFELIRSSSGPPRKQIQELFMFHFIVGSQMLTSVCYRNMKHKIKYINFYILHLLCNGLS